jgi:serine protease AprX
MLIYNKSGKSVSFIALISLFFLNSLVFSQDTTYRKYWIYFKDKGLGITENIVFSKSSSAYEVAKLSLSERAIKRRSKVLSADKLIDYTDLPVNEDYISQIQNIGVKVTNTSKWFNAITAYLNDDDVIKMKSLEFIKDVEPVAVFKKKNDDYGDMGISIDKTSVVTTTHRLKYGYSATQNELVNIPKVHDLDIDGSGVLVGMLDSGFRWRLHNSLKSRTVLSEYDFVFKDSVTANETDDNDVSSQDSHGTLCFSILGGYSLDTLIGPAYNSEFVLAKTEDIRSETTVEEDNWVSAIEWMEGLGVDVTSTSLGYNKFDNNLGNYTYNDMNGSTAKITKAADIAVTKGVVVVVAAGNEGDNSWKYITAPADGKYVIAVGATTSTGAKASFSSVGPTYDGRIKPDVSAFGVNVFGATAGTSTVYGAASGTSVACPLVGGVAALILSARPELTPSQIRDALRNTASRANNPDTLIGYGVVDAYKAVTYHGLVYSYLPAVTINGSEIKISIYLASNCTIDKSSVKVFYAVNGGNTYTSLSMTLDSLIDNTNTGRYIATIPSANIKQISFYFSGTDSLGTVLHPYSPVSTLQSTFTYSTDKLVEINDPVPVDYNLYQNYPNPFNPSTTIGFQLVNPGFVSLKIYDVLGREVITLVNEIKSSGYHKVLFDGSKLSSGVYFYKLVVSKVTNNQNNYLFMDIKKLVLTK